jgi:hypothetical protein
MTAPTRRQMMVAALAAGGAAAVPAGAVAVEPVKPYLDWDTLDVLTEGLPEPFRVMVLLNRIKTFPMKDRQRLVGQFRSNPGLAHIADRAGLAEGEGFEPSEALRPQRFSRPPHSTTLPPLHGVRRVAQGGPSRDTAGRARGEGSGGVGGVAGVEAALEFVEMGDGLGGV